MPSFLDRIRNFFGRGRRGPQQPPPIFQEETPPIIERPPAQPQQPQPQPRREPEPQPYEEVDNDVQYIRGYKPTHGWRVYGRWSVGGGVGEPGAAGLEEMLNDSGRRRTVTIIVEGEFVDPYPGDRPDYGWKSYALPVRLVRQAVHRHRTARAAINSLIAGQHLEYSHVETVQVIDSPEKF